MTFESVMNLVQVLNISRELTIPVQSRGRGVLGHDTHFEFAAYNGVNYEYKTLSLQSNCIVDSQ